MRFDSVGLTLLIIECVGGVILDDLSYTILKLSIALSVPMYVNGW